MGAIFTEIIDFLDTHNGSLMVIITLVYVIATILICRANIKSAKATKEQLAEAKRQYEEEHRAYITYQFIFERKAFYGIRFTNHGKRVANHVKVLFDKEFIDSIPKNSFTERSNELGEREFVLGIGQSYDFYFGGHEFRENTNKKPIKGIVEYQDSLSEYQEEFFIDFEKYATVFTVDSDADILHEDMKKVVKELGQISKRLSKISCSDPATPTLPDYLANLETPAPQEIQGLSTTNAEEME